VSGLIYQGRDIGAPAGVDVVQGVQFAGLSTGRKPQMLVIHETVTRSAETTHKVLVRRGLSVQLVGTPTGELVQHADLDRAAEHAGGARNPFALGLEVVNPYYPHLLPKKNSPWAALIDAPWAHKGQYVIPTRSQAEACAAWIAFATAPGSPLGIPREWPGLRGGRMSMGRLQRPADTHRGILAHTYFGHADGAWLVLYAWLRIEAKLGELEAYQEAVCRAAGVRHVDVRDLL
jgi:hypothetical protein